MSTLCCPNCGCSCRSCNGHRSLSNGEYVQRYLCKECGHRYSEKKLRNTNSLPQENLQRRLNNRLSYNEDSQLCAITEAKKLENAIETKTIAGESLKQDVKGKIIDFSFWMLKEGYSKSTIKTRTKILQRLVRLQADILNPESVKETIAKQQ